ncbi:hypothetical protein [Streptomyces sp. KLOTTS4A1]|uniref:hypothetical protein n=1 Tax=Streptomyces sp. KLOTTS4A1 TaxID=3390996 RepID=UPI0039F5E7D4
MTVDPTEPDTFEQEETLDPDAPEADAAEQHTELRQHRDDPAEGIDPSAANVADVAEQARVVELDEEDYR